MVAGLALGADGSIGSTFNFMYPHYHKIYTLFHGGKIEEARLAQVKANNIMEALCEAGLIPAIKDVLKRHMGIDVGLPRRPFRGLNPDQQAMLDQVLENNLIS